MSNNALSSFRKRLGQLPQSNSPPSKIKNRSLSHCGGLGDKKNKFEKQASTSSITRLADSSEGQWKRSPEADAIMQMLKREAEKDLTGSGEERTIVPVDSPVLQRKKVPPPVPPPRRRDTIGSPPTGYIPGTGIPINVNPEPEEQTESPPDANSRAYLSKLSTPRDITIEMPKTPERVVSTTEASETSETPNDEEKEENTPQEIPEKQPESTNIIEDMPDEPPLSGVVWKRNPEAEKIMKMLQAEGLGSPDGSPQNLRRNTVSIEAEVAALASGTSPKSPRSRTTEEDKKDKKLKISNVSGRLFKTGRSHSMSKKEFSITRSDDDSKAGLDDLGKEFDDFSRASSLSPRELTLDSPKSPKTPELSAKKEIDKRTQIVLEIRASERSYCTVLETLKDNYCAALVAQAKANTIDIPENRIKQIFSNISLINNINQMLFSEIDSRVNNWSDTQIIGDVFVDVIPYLKIYDTYGNNYDNSLEVLKECQKNVSFANALSQIEESTETNLRIESMLIAPIQRLPRYILLLTDLKKKTPEDHPDHELLSSAIPSMQNVADHVDKNIHQARNKQKLVELSSGGASSLLLAHRNLIKEAEVRCENKKKPTAFYLFNDVLVHLSATKAKHKPNLTLPSAQWPLHLIWFQSISQDNLQVVGPTEDNYLFKLTNPDTISFINSLRIAVDDDLKKQNEKRENSGENILNSVESPKRFGSYRFANSVEYIGEWVNGKMQGKGKWKFLDHEYSGEFFDNKKVGNGSMIYFSGNKYCGEWEDDLPHGKGTLEYPSSEKYEGEFKKGAKNGYGTMTLANGDVFDGYWKDNKPDGFGTFNYHKGSVYSGNFENGRYHNYGVLTCSKTGMKYEGEWANGFRDGKGRMEYKDGSYYDGFWKNGLREGAGIFVSNNEGTYNGEWVGDLKQGKGSMEFVSGNVYDGFWNHGMFDGHGKMIYCSGSITLFDGEWSRNKKSGKGIIYFSNGDSFEGQFKDDMMNGAGIYTFANGLVVSGKWVNGVQEGKSTISTMYKSSDQQTYTGTLRDNIWTPSDKSPPLHFHTVPDLRFDPW